MPPESTILSRLDHIPSGPPVDVVSETLDQLASAVLLFRPDEHHNLDIYEDPSANREDAGYTATTLVDHATWLATTHYWDDLYVKRDQGEVIAGRVDTERYLELLGAKGTGKSTIALWYRDRLNNTYLDRNEISGEYDALQTTDFPRGSVVYLNVSRYRTWKNRIVYPGAAPVVCDAVAHLVRERLLVEIPRLHDDTGGLASDLLTTWRGYLVQTIGDVDTQADWEVVNRYRGAEPTEQVMVALIERESKAIASIQKTYNELPGFEKIGLLAEFAASHLDGHRITIIVDNLDAIVREVETSVFREARSLRDMHLNLHFLICARPATARHLQDYDFGAEQFDRSYDMSGSDANSHRLEITFDFILKTLEARLAFVKKVLELASQLPSYWEERWTDAAGLTAELLTTLGSFEADFSDTSYSKLYRDELEGYFSRLIRSLERTRAARSDAVKHRHRPVRPDQYLDWIWRWHNLSLRSCLAELKALVDLLLNSGDPTLLEETTVHNPAAHNRVQYERSLRTLFTFGDSQIPRAPVMAGALLPTEYGCFDPETRPPKLNFPLIYTVQHLLSSKNQTSDVNNIASMLGLFGVSREASEATIRALAARRSRESEGLVELDCMPHRMKEGFALDMPVALTTAGEFYYRQLLPSVEYLCWVAATTPLRGTESRAFFELKGATDLSYGDVFGAYRDRALLATWFAAGPLLTRLQLDIRKADRNISEGKVRSDFERPLVSYLGGSRAKSRRRALFLFDVYHNSLTGLREHNNSDINDQLSRLLGGLKRLQKRPSP